MDEDIPDEEGEIEDTNTDTNLDDLDDRPISMQTAVEEFTSWL